MKVLVFSDMHFLSAPSEMPEYGPNRLNYQLKACEWLAEMVKTHDPDCVVNLGDSNCTHAAVTMHALQAFGLGMDMILSACAKTGAPFFIVAGNHDQADKNGEVSFLGGMAPCRAPIRLVMSRPVVFGEHTVGMIPYTHDPQLFAERLKTVSRCQYVLIHQDIRGAVWAPGRPATIGHDLSWLGSQVPGQVIGGHYHHPQRFKDKRFAVVGSPFYASWSDHMMQRPRGALLITDGKYQWLRNPYTPLRHTLRVKSWDDVLGWISSAQGKSAPWFDPAKDLPDLMLRLIAPSAEVLEQTEAELQSLGLKVRKLLGRVHEQHFEIRVAPALALDEPASAVRAMAGAVGATAPEVAEVAAAGELEQLGLQALHGEEK